MVGPAGRMIGETSGPRFDLLISRFARGESVGYRDIYVALTPDGATSVSIQSSWTTGSMTIERVRPDLDTAAAQMQELKETSPQISELVAGRPLRVNVVDDYGMGSALICQEENGAVKWAPGYGGNLREFKFEVQRFF